MTTKNNNASKQKKDKNELNNYHVQLLTSRALKALNAREDAFIEVHEGDADADLIAYVKSEALRLGHAPRQGEIEGWRYLEERFGTWKTLLEKARLKPFGIEEPFRRYALFTDEYERQAELYAEHKRYKKQRSIERKIGQAERKKQQEAYLLEHPEARKKKKKKKPSADPGKPAEDKGTADTMGLKEEGE